MTLHATDLQPHTRVAPPAEVVERLGEKLRWHRPECPELPPDQAKEVRERLLTAAERREQYIALITAWTTAEKERRVADSMSRQELAALDSLGRLLGQRQSLVDNLAYYYREQPRADCAPGLLALVTILSDNKDGCSTLSVSRMAEILSRSDRQIRDALRRLVDAACVRREMPDGAAWRYWPVVSKAFGDAKMILSFFVDALSAPPAPRGRPAKNPSPSTSPHLQAGDENPFPSTSALFGKTPEVERENPSPFTSTESTRDTTVEEEHSSAHARESHGVDATPEEPSIITDGDAVVQITEGQLETFRDLADTFGRRRGVMLVAKSGRADTDPILRGLVRDDLGSYPPDIAAHALSAALRDAQAVHLRDQQDGSAGKGRGGLPALTRYLTKVVRSEADERTRARDISEAKNRTEKAVQERIATKRIAGVERGGGGGRRRGTAVADDVFEVRQ